MASFSRTLEQTLHRALSLAGAKKHEFATLEHLLFALTEDQDAIAVMRACNVDVDKLRERVGAFIDLYRRPRHPDRLRLRGAPVRRARRQPGSFRHHADQQQRQR